MSCRALPAANGAVLCAVCVLFVFLLLVCLLHSVCVCFIPADFFFRSLLLLFCPHPGAHKQTWLAHFYDFILHMMLQGRSRRRPIRLQRGVQLTTLGCVSQAIFLHWKHTAQLSIRLMILWRGNGDMPQTSTPGQKKKTTKYIRTIIEIIWLVVWWPCSSGRKQRVCHHHFGLLA